MTLKQFWLTFIVAAVSFSSYATGISPRQQRVLDSIPQRGLNVRKKDKSDLYNKWPQLKDFDQHGCSSGIARMFINQYSNPYQSMWQSSLKMITDYGDKPWCESNRLKEEKIDQNGNQYFVESALASYASAQSNSTNERGIARMGFCLPAQCDQTDIDGFMETYMDMAAFGLGAMAEMGVGMNMNIMRPYSVPGMMVTSSNQRHVEWQNRTHTGMCIVLTFTLLICTLTIVVNMVAVVYGNMAFIPQDTAARVEVVMDNNQSNLEIQKSLKNLQEDDRSTIMAAGQNGNKVKINASILSRMQSEGRLTSVVSASSIPSQDLSNKEQVVEFEGGENTIDNQNKMQSFRAAKRLNLIQQLTSASNSNYTETPAMSPLQSPNLSFNSSVRFSEKNQVEEMMQSVEVEKVQIGFLERVYRIFSVELCFKQIWDGPIGPDTGKPGWESDKHLEMLAILKFIQEYNILILLDASYMNLVSALNPWNSKTQYKSPMCTMLLLGIQGGEAFFMFSGFIAFYQVNKIFDQQGGLTPLCFFKLYLKRYIRMAPGVFFVLFFGVYVMPFLHGGKDDIHNPIWFSFEEILFYRCTDPKIMTSKLFFYSNLWPIFQDDKSACMSWSWAYECDFQLFLLVPFFVVIYRNGGKVWGVMVAVATMVAGWYISYHVAHYFQLTLSVMSLQDGAYLFSYIKMPYTKLHLYAFGILSSMFYQEVKAYRMGTQFIQDDPIKVEQKKNLDQPDHVGYEDVSKTYPIIHFLSRKKDSKNGGCCKKYTPGIILYVSALCMMAATFSPFPVMQYPYKWSDAVNAWWYLLSRIGWSYPFMVFFFWNIMGHSTILKNATSNWLINQLNAMIWPMYLIAPLVYMNMYASEGYANYMTNLTNSVMGMGAMVCTVFGGLAFLILILNPLNNIFKLLCSDCLQFKRKGKDRVDKDWATQSYRMVTS